MSVKKEFSFPSRDGINTCHACSWEPDNGNIRAVFQIVHGMQEYIERYNAFAEFLASNGFLVVGEDHLGHGHTAATEKDLGYFTKDHPETVIVRDVHRLKKMTQEKYPGIPYFILGHSMGSFILRKYLTMYGNGIDGAIIAGTGVMPAIVTGLAIFLTNVEKVFFGDRHISPLIDKIAFGGYNKKIKDAKSPSDWICSDRAVVRKYDQDSLCTFKFSVNAYRTLFKILNFVCRNKNLVTVPKELPILILSGDEDPVGAYGKGPQTVYEQYVKIGITDLGLTLYPGMRHEILNEKGNSEVYSDILNWTEKHFPNN